MRKKERHLTNDFRDFKIETLELERIFELKEYDKKAFKFVILKMKRYASF